MDTLKLYQLTWQAGKGGAWFTENYVRPESRDGKARKLRAIVGMRYITAHNLTVDLTDSGRS